MTLPSSFLGSCGAKPHLCILERRRANGDGYSREEVLARTDFMALEEMDLKRLMDMTSQAIERYAIDLESSASVREAIARFRIVCD